MEPPEIGMRKQREQMVAQQIEGRGISDPAVLGAMRQVPREAFVAEQYKDFAYDDGPLPLIEGQTISQPYVVALMIDSLGIGAGDRVLEIGTGSGYAAAILSRIAGQVYSVERLKGLVDLARSNLRSLGYDNVHILHGDGTLGWPEHAPYDGMIVAAGGPKVPQALKEQLVVGGRLVIPVGAEQRAQRLVRVTRDSEDHYSLETLSHVRFVPLIGAQGWKKESPKWLDVF